MTECTDGAGFAPGGARSASDRPASPSQPVDRDRVLFAVDSRRSGAEGQSISPHRRSGCSANPNTSPLFEGHGRRAGHARIQPCPRRPPRSARARLPGVARRAPAACPPSATARNARSRSVRTKACYSPNLLPSRWSRRRGSDRCGVRRFFAPSGPVSGVTAPMATAQEQVAALADIRQELSVLYVEIQRPRGELNTTGGVQGSGGGGTLLSRVDAIEAECAPPDRPEEELQIRNRDRVVSGRHKTGSANLGSFRLCELGKTMRMSVSPGRNAQASRRRGAAGRGFLPRPPTPVRAGRCNNGGRRNRADFDRRRRLRSGRLRQRGPQLFETFTMNLPGGPMFGRGAIPAWPVRRRKQGRVEARGARLSDASPPTQKGKRAPRGRWLQNWAARWPNWARPTRPA